MAEQDPAASVSSHLKVQPAKVWLLTTIILDQGRIVGSFMSAQCHDRVGFLYLTVVAITRAPQWTIFLTGTIFVIVLKCILATAKARGIVTTS